jgi:diadenosine tetraphosphatase ApaH/serine/threonine PP2A family protein phosphatase
MIVLGGRTDDDVKSIPIEVYDTETSEWVELAAFNKFRHSSWIFENQLFTHGGFDYSSPQISKNDLVMIDVVKLFNINSSLAKKLERFLDKKCGNSSKSTTSSISPNSSNNSINNITGNFNQAEFQLKVANANKVPTTNTNKKNVVTKKTSGCNNPIIIKDGEISILSNKVDDKVIIKKILFDEKGKVKINNQILEEPLYDKFLKVLLNPLEWIKKNEHNEMAKFPFHPDDIIQLTHDCIDIVSTQPIVLRVSTPCKVFGDIHGQYIDLMTFFYKWGEPKEGSNGDINAIDYLFLGDYVDRGNMSLETMCLLMALKVKYPDRIHLLRGNHEDRMININFGFYEECEIRIGENSSLDDSVFASINDLFDYLPLAAVIEDQILCLHGGIGANVNKISDIECIQRPLEVVHEATNKNQQVVMDILWSDPTDNDDELGIQPNLQRDSNNYGNIVKYGPDVVKKFLQNNNLGFIIRAHECVLDGFERFAGGSVITLFSATDYCRRHNNAGAMLIIKNNFEMVPHLIYPPDGGNKHWIDDESSYKKRPPTPPRIRYNKNY